MKGGGWGERSLAASSAGQLLESKSRGLDGVDEPLEGAVLLLNQQGTLPDQPLLVKGLLLLHLGPLKVQLHLAAKLLGLVVNSGKGGGSGRSSRRRGGGDPGTGGSRSRGGGDDLGGSGEIGGNGRGGALLHAIRGILVHNGRGCLFGRVGLDALLRVHIVVPVVPVVPVVGAMPAVGRDVEGRHLLRGAGSIVDVTFVVIVIVPRYFGSC